MSFVPEEPQAQAQAYRVFGTLLEQAGTFEGSRAHRPAGFGLTMLGLWFTTLADTFFPKAALRRAKSMMRVLQATPDYQDLQQTLAGFPDLVLTESPTVEGEWRLAYFGYVDAQRRPVSPERRREGRATHFVAYLQARFAPWVVMLEKELRHGEWRLSQPGTGPWRREVPELLWFPSDD